MTPELIDERIKHCSEAMRAVEATFGEYQQVIVNTQNRYQQLKGALQELEWMKAHLNGAKE